MNGSVTTKINAEVIIKEPKGGIRFGTDALLLAHFALPHLKRGLCVDIGTGSGVIPLLCLAAGGGADFVGVEIQKEYAEAAFENAVSNGFGERFRVVCASAEETALYCPAGTASAVVTNPPYMRADQGKDNENAKMSVARREISGGAETFCRAAGKCLKSGGKFFAVYRPDRAVNLFCAMRENRIEPKRIKLVFPSAFKKPSLLLVEGIKDAGEGLVFEENLYIYDGGEHKNYSSQMKEIYACFEK